MKITIPIPNDLHQQAKKAAADQGRSLNEFVRRAIRMHVTRNQRMSGLTEEWLSTGTGSAEADSCGASPPVAAKWTEICPRRQRLATVVEFEHLRPPDESIERLREQIRRTTEELADLIEAEDGELSNE